MNENFKPKQVIDNSTKESMEDGIVELEEEKLIGKGWWPEVGTSMGYLNWLMVMNNTLEIFSDSEFIKSIEEGKYNLLIVDDASARIPALVFRKVINNIYNKNNFPDPKVLFVPGQLRSKDPNISEKISNYLNKYLEKIHFSQESTNALIITDTINEGTTLKILSDALLKSKINCEIVTESLWGGTPGKDTKEKKFEFEKMLDRKIFTAANEETSNTGGTDSRPFSNGVKKNTGDMVSQKIMGVQDHINQARKMVDKISEEIINQINSSEPIPSGHERYIASHELIRKYWSTSE